MQAHEPVAAVQATQLAIKHALAGQPGPVAVLFAQDSLSGTVKPDSRPGLYPTRYYLPPPPPAADTARVAAAAQALLAAERAGGDRRQRRAHRAGLRRARRAGRGGGTAGGRRRPPARAASPKPIVWRSGFSARSAPRRRMPALPRPIWCWRSARSSGRATPPGRTAICWTRRARPSSRSTSSRATHPGHSRPSTCWWVTPRRSCGNCTRRFDRMKPDGARPAKPGWPDGVSRRAISTRRATSRTISGSCRSGRSAS